MKMHDDQRAKTDVRLKAVQNELLKPQSLL
jgi:hypothetical protein